MARLANETVTAYFGTFCTNGTVRTNFVTFNKREINAK